MRIRTVRTGQAALDLGVSLATVRRLVADGVLPARRFGRRGHYRIRQDDVERLLAGEPGDAA